MRGKIISLLFVLIVFRASSLAAAGLACEYDTLNRLIRLTNGDGSIITYSYDLSGNRIRRLIELPDCNHNGVSDKIDIANRTSRDCNSNQIPDECDINPSDPDGNGNVSGDCNGNFIPDECDMLDVRSSDCNYNGLPDECEGLAESITNVSVGRRYCTIQAAIDDASAGHEIVVSPGIYRGAGNRDIDFHGKNITVRGIDPANSTVVSQTVIDCERLGRGVLFQSGEMAGTTLSGFTITNGLSPGGLEPPQTDGGGIHIFNSSPTIVNCRIIGNSTSAGMGSDGLLRDGGNGGGVACISSSPRILRCLIAANLTADGLSAENNMDWGGTGGHGGGVSCTAGSAPVIAGCIIAGNQTGNGAGGRAGSGNGGSGAGVYSNGSAPSLVSCLITRNVTGRGGEGYHGGNGGDGGGVYCLSSAAKIMHSTIIANTCGAGGQLLGVGGAGGGLWIDQSSSVLNCIVWGNDASTTPQVRSEGAVIYSCIQGGQAGTRNIDAAPVFVDADGPDGLTSTWEDNNYRLQRGSPCINTGEPDTDVVEDGDLDGQLRVQHCRIDMGAYESQYFLRDCQPNQIADECEADGDRDDISDESCDLCLNTIPGSQVDSKGCPPPIPYDCDRDGDVDLEDLNAFQACVSGPSIPFDSGCQEKDADADGDVDQSDFGIFQRCYSGAGNAAAPNCGGNEFSTTYGMIWVPAGTFEMGDHHDNGDWRIIHPVFTDGFFMDQHEVTAAQYCEALNWARTHGRVENRGNTIYVTGGSHPLCGTTLDSPYSQIEWRETGVEATPGREDFPIVGVTWHGAAAYANWRSAKRGLDPCYDEDTWACDFTRNGYRLPTEAEWEKAARSSWLAPYYRYPWGNEIDGSFANLVGSGDPFEAAYVPTTPVGFFDGTLRQRTQFGWPSSIDAYQTSNGANAAGFHDMAGNAWEWCNDWWSKTYWTSDPTENPRGPASGDYRILRGGSWNNQPGPERCASRNYGEPATPDYSRGCRLVLPWFRQ